MKIWPICVAGGLFLVACQPTTESLVDVGPERSLATTRHIVRSERLRNIMREMELLMFDRMYTELALEKELSRHAHEFERAATELAVTARNIPAATLNAELDPEFQIVFRDLAENLATEARELARLAAEQQYGAIAPQYERVSHICAGCHSLFRKPRQRIP